MTCRCKQFSDWLMQNASNSGMEYCIVVYNLYVQLTQNSIFLNNMGMSQVIYFGILLIATF